MKIICLLGYSASGKTTCAEELRKLGYNIIDSYTTRPKRTPNETGHKFVTLQDMQNMQLDRLSVEQQTEELKKLAMAYTYVNDAHYFTFPEQFVTDVPNVYVVDEAGIDILRNTMPLADIEVWVFDTPMEVCIQRMTQRGDKPEAIARRLEWDYSRSFINYADYSITDSSIATQAIHKPYKRLYYRLTGKLKIYKTN